VLNAWSRQGGRPSFDIVTGVSTGSLIAPFAFLGEQEDGELKAIYTGVSRKDIYHQRILSGLFGGPSLMSTRPLQALIARHITLALLDRIAAQHRGGRRLLVMTTNLDAERGVIWDMGAIAASGTSDRLSLFRQVLLASASIPGVFPRCSSMPMRMVTALRKCMSMGAR
jgi:predicted acylesterase/phospholipase RssA